MKSRSQALYEEAKLNIPGGVNSPVRAFYGVERDPVFIEKGEGAYIYDADGKRYIDYVCSWGPLILGHTHPRVLAAVNEALKRGFTFGAPTEVEIALAKKIKSHLPSIEMLRFVSSGTEAAMSAIRLARGATKRSKIIKFAGCYHGHADSLLARAGSGALTLGIPSSSGVPESFVEHTLVAHFNRLDEVKDLFNQYGEDIAAVIVEPVCGNMNLILPLPDFLPGLRQLCDQYGSVFIFDEVITGFRIGLSGAQGYFNVIPDLTILGKIVGGGFPAAAFGGKLDIMQHLAPLGPVYQAGTLSGNPIAMSAGLATLNELSAEGFYLNLTEKTNKLLQGLAISAAQARIPFQTASIGGMFGLFFTDQPHIETENDVKKCNIDLFRQFFRGMLNEGIYLAPSAFEVGFMSSEHQLAHLEATWLAAEKVFQQLRAN